MKCACCGSELMDGSAFCTVCGQKVAADPVAYPVMPPAGETVPLDQAWNSNPQIGSAEPAPQPKNQKTLFLLLGIVGGVAAVVILLLCLLIGPSGPMEEIALGVKNTMDAGSFTADISATMDGDVVDMTVQCQVDMDDREMTLYLEGSGDGDTVEIAIYDGYMIYNMYDFSYATDIQDELDEAFDAWEENDMEEISWEELLNSIQDGLYDEAEEYIDFQALDECLVAYLENLNDEDWMETYAGFSEKSKNGMDLYCFQPDLYDLSRENLKTFEPAFRDEELYEEGLESLREIKSELREWETELIFGLDGDELVYLFAQGDVDGDTFEIEVKFEEIGSTEIDMEYLDELLEEAENY